MLEWKTYHIILQCLNKTSLDTENSRKRKGTIPSLIQEFVSLQGIKRTGSYNVSIYIGTFRIIDSAWDKKNQIYIARRKSIFVRFLLQWMSKAIKKQHLPILFKIFPPSKVSGI